MRRQQIASWAYGVTTVPSRRDSTLPRTLQSLTNAGFPSPHLFVDGDNDGSSWSREFNLDVTCHGGTPVRAYGNWVLGLAELYLRNPTATYFAMFQDDILTYTNLRQYLERALWPNESYLNLYTIPQNTPDELRKQRIQAPDNGYKGFYASNQRGKGALGLVFRKNAVIMLLTHQHMVDRPLDPKRGHKALDGGVVTAMTKCKYREMVHAPSLTYHIGRVSAIGNKEQPQGVGFLGEGYDALRFLEG